MKIAATVTTCVQVGMEQWRDFKTTAVFDSSASFDDVLAWAAKHSKNPCWSEIAISEVVQLQPNGDLEPDEQTDRDGKAALERKET